ncbi:MAG: hypothetical protein ACK4PK_05025 [Alphaproteobacteria bacterium]|jgi:hypothetical protein
MLNIIHVFIGVLVACLLLTPAILPFWKVWRRLKTHHQDIWQAKGPFDPITLMAHGYVVKNFFEIINLADRDEALMERDPELVKWTRVAREMMRILPHSFWGQIGCIVLLFAMVYAMSSAVMEIFR